MLAHRRLAPAVGGASHAQADLDGTVVVAVLPFGTTVEKIAEVPEMAPGLVSAGLGSVPITQTFLDIGQGNRVNEDLYDGDLPGSTCATAPSPIGLGTNPRPGRERSGATSSPGLLASTWRRRAGGVRGGRRRLATLIAVDGAGA